VEGKDGIEVGKSIKIELHKLKWMLNKNQSFFTSWEVSTEWVKREYGTRIQ
jgi:hypothetical protein